MDKLKTVNIKGKEYVEVNERIKYFRTCEDYNNWSMESEIVSIENGVCIIKTLIKDEDGRIRATGVAYEKEGSTFINKTSYIENCETSSWGRALGNLGIGIDVSIASSEEVQNAIANQGDKKVPKATEKQVSMLTDLTADLSEEDVKKALSKYKVTKFEDLNLEQASKIIGKLKK